MTLRLSRFLLRDRSAAGSSLPILMYHAISKNPLGKCHPYFRLDTHPNVFQMHLEQLKRCGYKAVTLSEGMKHLERKSTRKIVALTFDDGYADFLYFAFSLLAANGFRATVFVPTDYIGDRPLQFDGVECLTWSQVRTLHQAGIEFGSHTRTHRRLDNLPARIVEREVSVSKQIIEDHLGGTIKSFAYPFAFPVANRAFRSFLRSALLESGYRYGVCTTIGSARRSDERLFLPRLPINSCDDTALFSAKISGEYDWMAVPQVWSKRLSHAANRFSGAGFAPAWSDPPQSDVTRGNKMAPAIHCEENCVGAEQKN